MFEVATLKSFTTKLVGLFDRRVLCFGVSDNTLPVTSCLLNCCSKLILNFSHALQLFVLLLMAFSFSTIEAKLFDVLSPSGLSYNEQITNQIFTPWWLGHVHNYHSVWPGHVHNYHSVQFLYKEKAEKLQSMTEHTASPITQQMCCFSTTWNEGKDSSWVGRNTGILLDNSWYFHNSKPLPQNHKYTVYKPEWLHSWSTGWLNNFL